jgi:hypothetical protein
MISGRNSHPGAMKTFIPTPRQTSWLLIVAFLAVGEALYIRYLAIENPSISLACQAAQEPWRSTWLCSTFHVAIALYNKSAFGWVALAVAALNLLRPSIVLITIAVAAAGMGLVLHNAGLAGLAVALLILSLARPAPAPE